MNCIASAELCNVCIARKKNQEMEDIGYEKKKNELEVKVSPFGKSKFLYLVLATI